MSAMKTRQVLDLSAYRITWIEYRPIKGVATKKDIKKLSVMPRTNSADMYTRCLYDHFPTREKALAHLASLKGAKLTKAYECRLFTDKQFGMRRADNGYAVPFTKKQLNDATIL